MSFARYTFSAASFADCFCDENPAELYRALNAELRRSVVAPEEERKAIVASWQPLVGHLLDAFKKLPQHRGVVFRAVPDDPETLRSEYYPGRIVVWGGCSSS